MAHRLDIVANTGLNGLNVRHGFSLTSGPSGQQQGAVSAVRDRDCFNWGYDPFHYTVPEGSYATDAGPAPKTGSVSRKTPA